MYLLRSCPAYLADLCTSLHCMHACMHSNHSIPPRGPATEDPVPVPCQPGDAGLEAVKWVTTPQQRGHDWREEGGGLAVGTDRPSVMSGSLRL